MKNNLLAFFCAGAALLSAGHAKAKSKAKANPRNVLLILVDDYGWNDTSCGGSRFYETPNIDRLARRGIQFTQGYAACAVSSPSRASILTGKSPVRHGITDWIGAPWGEDWRGAGRHSKLLPPAYAMILPQEEQTLPETLKQHGYKTFMAGKWHVGGEGSLPEDHGFDINLGGYEAGSPVGGYFSPYENPKLADGPKGENLSLRLAQETAQFIERQARMNKQQPFFAYLSFYAVHGPIQSTEKNWNHFRNKADSMGIASEGFKVDRTLPVRQSQDNPIYAGLIKQMDDAVGVVLDKLEELGLMENTLIIFTSDNGGVSSGDSYSTSCLPLRGGKGRQWEGGLRVPFIIHNPYSPLHGTKTDVPAIGMDFYPTILEYAGLPLLPKQHTDGQSLIPVLKGDELAPRSLYWHYPHYGNQGGEPVSIIRDGDWKLIHYYEDRRNELYNLKIDQTELEPLNAQYPDKEVFLWKKLSVLLTEAGAKYPVSDLRYDPVKETEYKRNCQTNLLYRLEKERKLQLSPTFVPNKEWWGSRVDD
ncbi:MAG: sulfatase [Macellibacteroides fermentans]|uniref:sulfatase n=1 Tax=Macellibacteroides fermentans TaxID=879969 RepID=UPI003AD0B770